jgi:hypothetical protein
MSHPLAARAQKRRLKEKILLQAPAQTESLQAAENALPRLPTAERLRAVLLAAWAAHWLGLVPEDAAPAPVRAERRCDLIRQPVDSRLPAPKVCPRKGKGLGSSNGPAFFPFAMTWSWLGLRMN